MRSVPTPYRPPTIDDLIASNAPRAPLDNLLPVALERLEELRDCLAAGGFVPAVMSLTVEDLDIVLNAARRGQAQG